MWSDPEVVPDARRGRVRRMIDVMQFLVMLVPAGGLCGRLSHFSLAVSRGLLVYAAPARKP
jgi:hypothetical protein